MTLPQLVEFLESLRGNVDGPDAMMIYSRLVDIAFMDHGVSDKHRQAAESMAHSIKEIILTTSSSNDVVTAFEAAANEQLKLVGRFGRGTVIWEAEERARSEPDDDYKSKLQQHLDQTSDTIAALAFSVHYYVAELMRITMAKNQTSPSEIRGIFRQLDALMANESSETYRAKVLDMARLIERAALPRNDA